MNVMNQRSYAIDVALIPETRVLDLSIEVNKRLIKKSADDSIVLGKNACLPHISLAMCGVASPSIDEISELIRNAVSGFMPYSAEFKDFAVVETSGGHLVSGMDIIRDDNIMQIQEQISFILREYCCERTEPEFFAGKPSEISEFSTDYSTNYLERQTGDNFSPHITLGHGNIRDIKDIVPPGKFECSRLAICQLGNNCTCAKVLVEQNFL